MDLAASIERPEALQTGLLHFNFILQVRQKLFVILKKQTNKQTNEANEANWQRNTLEGLE